MSSAWRVLQGRHGGVGGHVPEGHLPVQVGERDGAPVLPAGRRSSSDEGGQEAGYPHPAGRRGGGACVVERDQRLWDCRGIAHRQCCHPLHAARRSQTVHPGTGVLENRSTTPDPSCQFTLKNDFFLSSLGKNFLKAYYKASLKSESIIAVCVVNEFDKIQGFATGSITSVGFHKKLLLQNIFIFSIQGLLLLITKPRALFRLIKNLEKKSHPKDNGNYSELLSICLLPSLKGKGIGKELIKKYELEAKNKGCSRVALTTDYYNNENVIAFYKNTAYDVFYEFNAYPNRKMYKLIKKLDN